jgi:hypothetical protein
MNDKLNELAQKVYRAHRTAFDFVLENRPDPASELYPYFVTALNKAGFVIGSRNKGFVRFTSDKLSKQLPCTGQGWPDRELFLFEIDYFWNTKKAVVKAVIAPGDDKLRTRIHNAVNGLRDLKHPIRQPTGKKWWVFYINKSRSFVATEVANEDEAEIMKKVTEIVDDIKDDARAILAAIEKEICRA